MLILLLLLSLLRQPDTMTTLDCDVKTCNLTVTNVGTDVAYDVRGKLTVNDVKLPLGRASHGILAQRLNGDWVWVIGKIGVGQMENASFILAPDNGMCGIGLDALMIDEWDSDPTPENNRSLFSWECAFLPTMIK